MHPSRLLPALAVVALASCAASTPRPDSPNVSPKLKGFLAGLCEAMTKDACRPELTQVAGEDLATVVITELGEQEPEFGEFLTRALAGVEPAKRKGVIEQQVGGALGVAWRCGTLDALWANQRPRCE